MTPELLLAALLKILPNGKTIIPMSIVVDKGTNDIVVNLRIQISKEPVKDTIASGKN